MPDVDPVHLVQPAATRVRDPVSGRSAWLAGLVQRVRFEGEVLRFAVVTTPEHAPGDGGRLAEAIVANLRGQGWDGPIAPEVGVTGGRAGGAVRATQPAGVIPGMEGPGLAPHGGPIVRKPLDGVRHVVAVASGKGGVGKSTVAANLAVALRRRGFRVGLADADVHGPSVSIMMNVTARPALTEGGKAVPPMAYGVRCMSMGLLVDPNEAMIWRGPMVQGVVRQFLQDSAWGDLDVLLVDLPPGTGDAQLTLIQAVALSGAVIVTTPQEVALADAVRGIEMFRRLEVPLLGLVENMAWYTLPDGTRDPVFGDGGGVRVAASYGVDVLARLPLRTAIRKGGDAGLPVALGDDALGAAFLDLADQVAARLGIEATA
ncbi:MAG: Mrp/NBP35 family ATP-binding protein [Alphaproteobacteria bacterium]|nr:Mrp/NBP35 family ATP-binding protein [Alphaproteobacteria bacterium]